MTPRTGIGRFQPVALGAGVLGLAASAIGFVVDHCGPPSSLARTSGGASAIVACWLSCSARM